jgi:hypothetical protein
MFSKEIQKAVKDLGNKSYRLRALKKGINKNNWREVADQVRQEYVSSIRVGRVWGTECQIVWHKILNEAEAAGEIVTTERSLAARAL